MKKYILHDLPPQMESELFQDSNSTIISTKKAFARCKGCFGCWLKTPGICVLHDGMETLGSNVLSSDEIIIISESMYGGFSISMKRLWDRCIPGVLPFFRKINNELHHTPRYAKRPKLRVYFYNAKDMLPHEIELAKNLVKANALNFMSDDYEVHFLDSLKSLKEVVL